VRKHGSWIAVSLVLAVVAGAACKSQQSAEQQKKVEELQAQLDDAKKELAAKEEQAKAAEAPPAEPVPPPAAAPAPPPAAPKAPEAKPQYLTAEQGQQAKEQYAQDKEKVKGAFAEQAQTNEQVQQQIEELKPRELTLPAGTVIPVRTTTELSTKTLADGSVFDAVLEKGILVDGTLVAPQGAHVTGVVVSSDPGGKVKGVASLEVTIRQIAGVKDQTIRVKANTFSTAADTSKGRDAKRTGILAGAGAVVGAIAGGGKGAAIGAGAGAATGVGANMATRGKAAVIPAETLIEFTLAAPTTVVVQPQAR
jgi:uncharacterized membrane-anchored protein YhcB (DUF1043 family)